MCIQFCHKTIQYFCRNLLTLTVQWQICPSFQLFIIQGCSLQYRSECTQTAVYAPWFLLLKILQDIFIIKYSFCPGLDTLNVPVQKTMKQQKIIRRGQKELLSQKANLFWWELAFWIFPLNHHTTLTVLFSGTWLRWLFSSQLLINVKNKKRKWEMGRRSCLAHS